MRRSAEGLQAGPARAVCSRLLLPLHACTAAPCCSWLAKLLRLFCPLPLPAGAAREQENNSKHLQMVSGAPPTAFWLANFCWDCLNYALPAAGIVALVWWYNVPQLAGPRLAALTLLLGGTGAAGITCTYLCHFLFRVRHCRTLGSATAVLACMHARWLGRCESRMHACMLLCCQRSHSLAQCCRARLAPAARLAVYRTRWWRCIASTPPSS